MTSFWTTVRVLTVILVLGTVKMTVGQEVAEPMPAPEVVEPEAAPPPAAADDPTTEEGADEAPPAPLPPQEEPEQEPSGGETLPDGRLVLNFRDASLDAVLAFLSETCGLVVVGEVQVEGRVNVLSRHPLSTDEALAMLSTVLKEKGYATVRTGRTLKIVRLDDAKKSNIPVFSGSNPSLVSQTDEVITQVIPVRFADAVQLRRDLASLIPAYADLTANASTNTLILTDTSANVRRVMEIIQALDTAVSAVTQVKVFPLQYANAANAARLVTQIFQQEPPAQQQRGMPFVARFGRFTGSGAPGGASGSADQGGEGSRPQTKVTAASDDRTNTVVVSAPTDTMPIIEAVLKDLDANPAQDQAVFIYYLRNAQASNVEGVVNSLFNPGGTTGRGATTRTATPGATGTRGTAGTTGRTSGGTTGSTRTGTQTSMNLGQIGSGTRTSGAAGSTTSRAVAGVGGTPPVSAAAARTAADLAGQVYVVADTATNALLVMTNSGNFDRVKSILEELDRPMPQVLIKVLIAEVTHDNDLDLGIEFSAINLKTSGKTTVFTDFGVAAATGGLITKIVEPDINVALRALEKVGKLDVLSRPYVLTSDNQTASIIVGQRVPLINSSRITDAGQTINTLIYEDIGIILNVTPHINPDGLVIMDVAPEISALTGQEVPISDTASQPVIAKRAAQTRVAINDGQTIVIGGLMEDRKTETVQKVPLVGDIPLLGLLFQRHQTVKSKTELLIFLTPHVALEPEKLREMSEDETSGAVVAPKAVAPGVFEEHLQGLQRGGVKPPSEPAPDTPAEAEPVTE